MDHEPIKQIWTQNSIESIGRSTNVNETKNQGSQYNEEHSGAAISTVNQSPSTLLSLKRCENTKHV